MLPSGSEEVPFDSFRNSFFIFGFCLHAERSAGIFQGIHEKDTLADACLDHLRRQKR